MVFRPELPPRPGCVEIELDGERVYRNIETREILRPWDFTQPGAPEAGEGEDE